jgi:hypothetical protein
MQAMKQRSLHAGDEAKIIACMAMKQKQKHDDQNARTSATDGRPRSATATAIASSVHP